EVQPGESVAVMGPSGCGKSSLLYVIGGLAQASRGKVLVDGNDLTEMRDSARTKLRRSKIGFVFQRFNLLPTLSARGNIAIAQYIHGDGFDPHRFDVVTKMLGLEGRLTHKPSEMSGGEQQRVAIDRAIINEPKTLLAAQPTREVPAASAQVELLSEKGDQQVYKVDTRILRPPEQMPQLQNELHRALQRTESSLQTGRFEITNVEAIRDAQGAVTACPVRLRKK